MTRSLVNCIPVLFLSVPELNLANISQTTHNRIELHPICISYPFRRADSVANLGIVRLGVIEEIGSRFPRARFSNY